MPRHRKAKKDAKPAKSSGEWDKHIDPEVSEWGNPMGVMSHDLPSEYIGRRSETR